MSESIEIRPRLGLATRAKNANQRPGKILIDSRRRRRGSARVVADNKAEAPAAGHMAQLEDANLKQRPTRVVWKSTTTTEQPRSEGVGSGNEVLSGAPIQARNDTGVAPKPTCVDVAPAQSTAADPRVYDIVSIAQMIVAELASRSTKTTRDCIIEIQPQSYAPRSYYSHKLTTSPTLLGPWGSRNRASHNSQDLDSPLSAMSPPPHHHIPHHHQ